MDDGYDDAQQPRCPVCGSLLVDLRRGLHCRGCDLVYVEGVPGTLSPY